MSLTELFKERLNPTQIEAVQTVEWRNERLIAHFRLWLGAIANLIFDVINDLTSWQKLDASSLFILDFGLILYSLIAYFLTNGKYKPWVKNILVPADIIVISLYSYYSLPGVLTSGYFIIVLLFSVFRYRAFLTLLATLESVIAYFLVVFAWHYIGNFPIWSMPENNTLIIYSNSMVVFNTAAIIMICGVIFIYISRQAKILVLKAIERDHLARFLPRELIDEVEAGKLNLDREGHRIRVTVLFSDIRDFTSLSEELPPEQIVYLLNLYSDKMVQTIFAYGGMLDKFTGDGLMAVFGAPSSKEDDQIQAANAALAMQNALDELNKQFQMEGLPAIRMGIGLATGEVVAGSIGSKQRLDYTVIGDAVNIASRIQGLCRETGKDILTEEITIRALNELIPAEEVGLFNIRGKTKPIKIWTLLNSLPNYAHD